MFWQTAVTKNFVIEDIWRLISPKQTSSFNRLAETIALVVSRKWPATSEILMPTSPNALTFDSERQFQLSQEVLRTMLILRPEKTSSWKD